MSVPRERVTGCSLHCVVCEGGQTGRDIHLDLDDEAFEAHDGARLGLREHAAPPWGRTYVRMVGGSSAHRQTAVSHLAKRGVSEDVDRAPSRPLALARIARPQTAVAAMCARMEPRWTSERTAAGYTPRTAPALSA